MGLFTYILAGGGFVIVGASEAILSTSETPKQQQQQQQQQRSNQPKRTSRFSSSLIFSLVSLLSLFFIANSVISLTDALSARDQTGVVLQFEVISISSLFFLFSLLGLFTHAANSVRFPSQILNLLCLFGFVEEFFLFYLQRKDPIGIENRYFDLMLVPVCICIFSTVLELGTDKLKYSRLGRGVGLVLQGMWIIQMGFSFFSDSIVHGCSLHRKSRGNFTITCKGHPEYHRGKAIATLQFNCHLALLVALVAGIYAVIGDKHGARTDEFARYKQIGAEMQPVDNPSQFTLDTDEEEEEDDDDQHHHGGVAEEVSVPMEKALVIVPESGVNGYGSH